MAIDKQKKVSRRSNFVLVASSLCVFAFADMLTNLDQAFVLSMVFMVFMAIIQTKKESWADKRFWFILVIFAIIHISVLYFVHIPEIQFGLISLPFAFGDGFLMLGLINWIERRFTNKKSNDFME